MRRLTLLVADGDLRLDLLRSVRAAGYAADEVASSEDASVIAREAGDGILMKVSDSDDLRLLGAIRDAAPSLTIVALGSDQSADLLLGARRAGACEVLRMPFDVSALERALASAAPACESEARLGDGRFVTRDPQVARLLHEAERAAASEATIRIQGESGTGKSLLARWIHRRSARASGPFVVVSCSGLSHALAERELFGASHAGSDGQAGANDGRIAAASGGTLVLDEVGDLALSLQPRLLRVLQEREVVAEAGRSKPVDLRVIATTQRELAQEVAAGRFREDLHYRLGVIELGIPPLRERREDIGPLSSHLLEKFTRQHGSEPPLLSQRALAALRDHDFRGNVRELSNLMRRAAILFAGQPVDVDVLLARRARAPGADLNLGTFNLHEIARETIRRSLIATGGNRTQAAKALGISVRTLRNKLRAYGFEARDAANPAHSADPVSN